MWIIFAAKKAKKASIVLMCITFCERIIKLNIFSKNFIIANEKLHISVKQITKKSKEFIFIKKREHLSSLYEISWIMLLYGKLTILVNKNVIWQLDGENITIPFLIVKLLEQKYLAQFQLENLGKDF